MEPLLTLQKVHHYDGTISFRLLVTATLEGSYVVGSDSFQPDSNGTQHHRLEIKLHTSRDMKSPVQHLVKLGNTHPIPREGDSLTVTLVDENDHLLGTGVIQGGGGTILTDIEEDESSRPFPITPPLAC